MAAALGLAGAHGQKRLGPVKGLDLALFVNADHERLIGRVEVKADDVPHLLNELRVRRQLERIDAMRLEREGPPDAMNRGGRYARRPGHIACAPVGRIGRFLFKSFGDDRFNAIIPDLARRAASGFVVKTIKTMQAPLAEALPPHAHRLSRRLDGSRDLAIILPCCRTQNDFGALHNGAPALSMADIALKRFSLLRRKLDLACFTRLHHHTPAHHPEH